mgnify:CR=1 FL=1
MSFPPSPDFGIWDSGAKLVYTPLHGVGTHWVMESLQRAKHDISIVKEQEKPNGDFPTVAFPNPEEPGALDLAIELAEKYPEKDAQWINFVELRKLVLSLKNFEDDPERCNEKILESIQQNWIDEME